MKKGKLQSTTGGELLSSHEDWLKKGLTKEKAILFLFIEMNKEKSDEIGMDFSDNCGREFNITVALNDGKIEDTMPSPSPIKGCLSYVR